MTENCAAAVVMPVHYQGIGNVGGPIPCTEVKLQDTDDYKHTDVYPKDKATFESQVCFETLNKKHSTVDTRHYRLLIRRTGLL
jgi:long-subunit acyl-CoA synthetase (AMP-forming)